MPSMTLEQGLNAAVNLQRAGRLDDAEKVYRQILVQHPDCPDALHLLGVLCAQSGRKPEAIDLIRKAVALHPNVAGYYVNLGHVLLAGGNAEEAARAYSDAVRLNPQDSESCINLGIALEMIGRLDDAARALEQARTISPDSAKAQHYSGWILERQHKREDAINAYRRAISLQPGYVLSHNSLGNALFESRHVDEAIQSYRTAISIQPDFADAWSNLGNALREKGEFTDAIAAAKKALTIRPDFPVAASVLGDALRESGQIDEAIEQFHAAIALRPNMPENYINLALALGHRRRFDEAVAAIDKALQLRPEWAVALSNRGKLLRDHGRLDEAMASARRALQISPDLAEAQINLAGCLMDSGDIDAAMDAVQRALRLGPNIAVAHNLAANVFKEAGAVDEAIAALDRAIELQKANASFHSNKVYLLEFDARCDASGLLAEQRRWNDRHAGPLNKFVRPHENDRDPDRRLRIGYVSPYFRDHAESFFVVPLLESHDRGQFEIYCYSDADHPDAVTERIRRCSNVWRQTTGLSHEELANQIRGDRIDVLVDLAMHMAFNRALMFAQKPAPVQVAWLAYPGGTGLDAMDYRVTDPWIDPVAADDSCYHEKSVRLPQTWVCFDPMADVPPAAERFAGPICFGSINNPCKLNEPLLELWARVLSAVPGSSLLLQALSKFQRKRIVQLLQARGIEPTRLQFAPRCLRDEYRKLYDRIDICLDPLPYNGITTTCDGLWMGVPVISLAGSTAAGRAGASILANIGLSELATDDADKFVNLAVSLAGDFPRRTELRRTLRGRMERSPMMDGAGFARNMESAYRQMWTEWCREKSDMR
jgi:predicted O-linked N-acetylglucosamine transferase (SPINDLY family)